MATTSERTIIMTESQLRSFAREVVRLMLADDGQRKASMMLTEGEWLTPAEAQAMLKTSARTLGRLAESGDIIRKKVRGVWRYDRESLGEYLKLQLN